MFWRIPMRIIKSLTKRWKLSNRKIYVLIIFILTVWSVGFCKTDSKKILITFFSKTGFTKQMAESVAEGAKSIKGTEVKLLSVLNSTVSDILWADAIIIGTPVHNSNTAIPIQKFINKWPINGGLMKNKLGAVFVTAGGISSGEELTMMNLIHSMLIYNMIIVGGTDWKSPFGASAITEEPPFNKRVKNPKLDPYFLEKGKKLGKRVASILIRFKK